MYPLSAPSSGDTEGSDLGNKTPKKAQIDNAHHRLSVHFNAGKTVTWFPFAYLVEPSQKVIDKTPPVFLFRLLQHLLVSKSKLIGINNRTFKSFAQATDFPRQAFIHHVTCFSVSLLTIHIQSLNNSTFSSSNKSTYSDRRRRLTNFSSRATYSIQVYPRVFQRMGVTTSTALLTSTTSIEVWSLALHSSKNLMTEQKSLLQDSRM